MKGSLFLLRPLEGPVAGPIEAPDGESIVVGRSSECDVVLSDESISRRHFALARRGASCTIRDLGSSGGTRLNGTALEPQIATPLQEGDYIRVGPVLLCVDCGGPARHTLVTTTPRVSGAETVETTGAEALGTLAQQRLSLLIEGSRAMFGATTEHELAVCVAQLLQRATGYSRCAVLRWTGELDAVDLIHGASVSGRSDALSFSRSLLQNALAGGVARMSLGSGERYAHSIMQLRIREAICAALVVDDAVAAFLYADAREDESPVEPDSTGFAHGLAQFASLALANIAHSRVRERQKEIDRDLEVAQVAQSFLFPPADGQIRDLVRYASRVTPSASVGGDLFDIFAIDDHRVGMCFGDVSGHGIGAAMVMTTVLTHLRVSLGASGSVDQAVREANKYLTKHSAPNIFSTAFIGVYDSVRLRLDFVDAGHGHWLLRTPAGLTRAPQSEGGPPLGIHADALYGAGSVSVDAGERLVLYSDGIVEQPGAGSARFGRQRLEDHIRASGSPDADILILQEGLLDFAESLAFADDTSIASIEFMPVR